MNKPLTDEELLSTYLRILEGMAALIKERRLDSELARKFMIKAGPFLAYPGLELIIQERTRQVYKEGWTAKHDDKHKGGQLALAAASYAVYNGEPDSLGIVPWPFEESFDKRGKTTKKRLLEIAGALIAAEIDRITREERRDEE